jgi:hypothetical protein
MTSIPGWIVFKNAGDPKTVYRINLANVLYYFPANGCTVFRMVGGELLAMEVNMLDVDNAIQSQTAKKGIL